MPAKKAYRKYKNYSNELKAKRMSRNFLLILLVGISLLFINMVFIFLMPVFLAAVFTGLTYPMYERFLNLFRGRKGLASFCSCLVLILLILGPVALLVDQIRVEAINYYETNESQVQEMLNDLDAGLISKIKENEIVKYLGINIDELDYKSTLQEAAKRVGSFLLGVLTKTKEGFEVLLQLIMMLFTMYYFYKDGDKLINWIKYLSPLDDKHENSLIERFVSVSRATIKGTLLIGMTQGSMGAITLAIFGISAPILWGLVMAVLSIVPMVGAWLVLLPVGLFKIFTGSIWQGSIIIGISFIVIGNIDNLMRPKLVGKDTGMHDLMIFFSTIGGLAMFGLMGFIIGPVVAVLFLTILNIYSIEFGAQLNVARNSIVKGPDASE